MKKKCAREALKYIKDKSIIGLGAGTTISYLVSYIKEVGLDVEIVTPSFQTEKLCIENGLKVLPAWSVDSISVAFDGCDEIDYNLTALKSGGGIHTKEKIIATMAEQYILLGDVKFNSDDIEDISRLDKELKNMVGVVDTSLFYNIVTKAIIAEENGIRIIERERQDVHYE